MTQALALRALMEQVGHRVCSVLVGRNTQRDIPDFFLDKIGAPVAYIESPNFAWDIHNQSVQLMKTFLQAARRTLHFRESLRQIDRHLRRHQPDVVVNFFEPLGGLYYAFHRPAIPMVAIAHQYMFLHPAYRFPPGYRVQRMAMKLFTRLTALGASRKLALSLYPASNTGSVSVLPPLLRDQLFLQTPVQQESFILIYLLNSGYAKEIIRWHEQHPDQILHCFWDNRDAADVERYDETLTFHRLDDEKFLAMMSRCRGLVTTAGFESISEAMYLGKPVLAVPVKGHFEQYCNSLDVVAAGAGLSSLTFDIERLLRFLPSYRNPVSTFHGWLNGAKVSFVHEIELVAAKSRIR